MLDTNTACHIIKGHSAVLANLRQCSPHSLCLSAITKAELLYGVARKPEAKQLVNLVKEFLDRVDIIPWGAAAIAYGPFRAKCNTKGVSLGSMDMLIAAHAVAVGAVLVSDDRAFSHVGEPLQMENWVSAPG
jgi:tRNA(fMet)-specific endonuclease VapC